MSSELYTEQKCLLLRTLAGLLKKGEETDIALECKDGIVTAHKFILKAGSTYFRSLFNADVIEAKTEIDLFRGFSQRAVDSIISYLYCQEIPSDLSNEQELREEILSVSHLMQLEPLFDYCWNSVSSSITTENYLDVWRLAENYSKQETTYLVLKFMSENLECFTTEFCPTVNQIRAFLSIVFSNTCPFTVEATPDDIFFSILQWGLRKEESEVKLIEILEQLYTTVVPKVSDNFLNYLLEHQFSTKWPQLKNQVIKEIVSRWGRLQELNLKIHLFLLTKGEAGTTVYNPELKKWSSVKSKKLKGEIATYWYPAVSKKGEHFYFAINRDKKYVAVTDTAIFVRVTPDSHKLVPDLENNVSNGDEIYFRDSPNSMAVFNFEKKMWTTMCFSGIKETHTGRLLLVANRKVYFDCIAKDVVCIYDWDTGEWKTEKKPHSNLRSVKTKCLHDTCVGKLFFFKMEEDCNYFVTFDISSGQWEERLIPLNYRDCSPLIVNCDNYFLMTNVKVSTNFEIFIPNSEPEWRSLPAPGLFAGNRSGDFIFDLSFNRF